MQTNLLHVAFLGICAFLGGFVSQQFFSGKDAVAAAGIEALRGEINNSVQVFYDRTGKRRIDLDASGGSPIQDFYGANGRLRLQLGTYSGDETAGGDAGLPLIGLSDREGRLRLLLRLAQGNNQSPVLVMKDSKGRDRVILGTALNDKEEEPFLVYFDQYNVKHSVFGNF